MGLYLTSFLDIHVRECVTSRDMNFTFCNTVYRLTSGYCSLTDDEHHLDRTPHRYKFHFDSEI